VSNKIKAILLKKIKDKTILLEALKELQINYSILGNEIQLTKNCKLIEKDDYIVAEILENYYSQNIEKETLESNNLIQSILSKYTNILNEKIKEIRRLEIEGVILASINKQEAEAEKNKRQKELLRLDNIRKNEQKALEKQIQESISKIIENSEKNGYSVQEKRHENERVLILVRR
jgi:hypothetical protein